MKPIKIFLTAAIMVGVAFAANKASAVLTEFTVSGTALYQNYDNNDNYKVGKQSLNQKDLLFLLEQATGDTSITNKNSKTKIYYDADAFNENASFSNEGYDFNGVFYYSNSIAGLQTLDGIDGSGDYYSYIEFDFVNYVTESYEGFWSDNGVEGQNIFAESAHSETGNGNGVLYIHDNPYSYDLPDGNLYYANNWEGNYNNYAIVIHGPFSFTQSFNNGDTIESEKIKLSGSGDGIWDGEDLVVSGKASANGKAFAP